jgi:hypothetical protein
MQPSPALSSADGDERCGQCGRPPSLRSAQVEGSLSVYDSCSSCCSHSTLLQRFMQRGHARPLLTREGAATVNTAASAQRRRRSVHPAPTPPHSRSSDAQPSCTAIACMPVALLRATAVAPLPCFAAAARDGSSAGAPPPLVSSPPSLVYSVHRTGDGGSRDVTLLLISGQHTAHISTNSIHSALPCADGCSASPSCCRTWCCPLASSASPGSRSAHSCHSQAPLLPCPPPCPQRPRAVCPASAATSTSLHISLRLLSPQQPRSPPPPCRMKRSVRLRPPLPPRLLPTLRLGPPSPSSRPSNCILLSLRSAMSTAAQPPLIPAATAAVTDAPSAPCMSC